MIDNIIIFDIETLKCMYLWVGYIPKEDKWYVFEISKRKNDVYAFIKFLEEHEDFYYCGFSSLRFDSQVVEWIMRRYHNWYDLTNTEVVRKIYQFSQDVINDINFGKFPPYRDTQLSTKNIDLFGIHGYENLNRRTSLKWWEFMLDMPNIEEMPYEHWRDDLTDSQLDEVIDYCKNDIKSTYKGYQYTIGECDHPFYTGKNKIQDRLDHTQFFKFGEEVLSYSDVKIGDDINKRGYLDITGKSLNDLYILKKNRKSTPKFTFGDCIPKYVKFQTPEFNAFYRNIKDVKVRLGGGKQEFKFEYNNTKYTIAKGGIHTTESNVIIRPNVNESLISFDIGSQYPAAIIKRSLYPSHLGKPWLINYKKQTLKRLDHKALSKNKNLSEKDIKMHSSMEKGMKLSINGAFGKTSETTSWQYDPTVTFFCTIGNQFEILMLIETLEINGIHIVSANTDGAEVLVDNSAISKFYDICHKWEETVGNTEIGRLEFEEYEFFVKESVNHYIARTTSGDVKIKGRFDVDVELHKNNTDKIGRIERLAIQKYFLENIPVEQTIRSCVDIYKFCIGAKASREYHYETAGLTDINTTVYQRLVRFYVSNTGKRLYKIKNGESEATGAKVTKICGENLVTVCNKMSFPENFEDYNINYDFYINRAQEIIDKIERGKKAKFKKAPKEQLSLF